MPARVMIVEDDLHIALLLQYNLEAKGFEVEHFAQGDDIEVRIAQRMPDLLLLAWTMPGFSGINLCQRLRKSIPMDRLPIMMLTARTDKADRDYAFRQGANDYVAKPFSLSEVLSRANGLVLRAHAGA